MKGLLLLGLTLGLIFISCNQKKKSLVEEDSFYSSKGGLDLRRIPLVDPYELLKVNGTEWRLNLFSEIPIALSIHNVKGINVSNKKIVIYSQGGTEVRHKQFNEVWFIIDPIKRNEQAFDSYNSYIYALKRNGFRNASFSEPDSVYNDFYNTGTIKWPDSDK